MSDLDHTEILAYNELPATWNPRREQPEWDRDFSGRAEIQHALANQTDKAVTYVREALAFSAVLKGGFGDGGEDGVTLADFGAAARHFIAKGKKQGLDA